MYLNYRFYLIIVMVVYISGVLYCQTKPVERLRIMFYNVENFFDVYDDSLINDIDFTPDGAIHWTKSKYLAKRNNIYKTILSLGEGQPPAVVGLAEVENRRIIDDLIINTPLSRWDMGIVHFESNDHRGMDVSLLYRKNCVRILYSKSIIIKTKELPDVKTRDILYSVLLINSDTIHVFVNHWTSRYRGLLESETLRLVAADVVRSAVDSLYSVNPNSSIVVMGDFNDCYENVSVSSLCSNNNCNLINMIPYCENPDVKGTYKYHEQWLVFDQILLSNSLAKNDEGLAVCGDVHVFAPGFLLESDFKYTGIKPNRTHIGYKYHGGFSDHLPVYVDLCY